MFVHGGSVDLAGLFPGGERVELPTYAFQRHRYWLTPTPTTGNLSSAGLHTTDHPLLAASVDPHALYEDLYVEESAHA